MTRTVMMWRSSRSGTPALGAEMERAETEQSLSMNVSLVYLLHIKEHYDQSCMYGNFLCKTIHAIHHLFPCINDSSLAEASLNDTNSSFVPRFSEKYPLRVD